MNVRQKAKELVEAHYEKRFEELERDSQSKVLQDAKKQLQGDSE